MVTEQFASERLAVVFGDLAVALHDGRDDADTLMTIVKAAAKIVPGARWAGITVLRDKKLVAVAPTGPMVTELDELQLALGDGPCLTALRESQTVRIDDMRTDTRWREYAEVALGLGVLGQLSFQLFTRSKQLGTLALYAQEAAVFTEESVLVGSVLAQHAAVAMAGSAAERQFDAAIASRDVIGQAKGMLMVRNNVTGLAAFDMLVQASQQVNMKLVDVARWLVSEHEGQAPAEGGPTAS